MEAKENQAFLEIEIAKLDAFALAGASEGEFFAHNSKNCLEAISEWVKHIQRDIRIELP